MKSVLNNTAAVILAAGKGTRMGGTTSKVLRPILGRPMISYTISNIKNVPINEIYLVTGHNYEAVQSTLGRQLNYVHQKEQLGTAHAVNCALYEIPTNIETIVVMNGDDSAFYDPLSITRLIESHHATGAVMTVLSAVITNPYGLGRIIRDNGQVTHIVEESDATDAEKQIKEINTGCYVFDIDWLRTNIDKIVPSKSGEYYIVSLLALAVKNGHQINVQSITDKKKWWGVNTPSELETSSEIMLNELTNKNRPRLFVLDFDNVLLNTHSLKEKAMTQAFVRFFTRNFNQSTAQSQIKEFWRLYDELKKEVGWISVPELVDAIATKMNLDNIAIPLKRVLFSLPFADYVFPGVISTINYLRSRGKVIILSEGDIVYGSSKILGSGVISNTEDLYITENKADLFPSILRIYNNYDIIAVDDQVPKLESLAQLSPLTSIWVKQGPYQNRTAINPQFKPDYEINTFAEVENIVRNLK